MVISEGLVQPLLGVEDVLLVVLCVIGIHRILVDGILGLLVLVDQHELVAGRPRLLSADALLGRLALLQVLGAALVVLDQLLALALVFEEDYVVKDGVLSLRYVRVCG